VFVRFDASGALRFDAHGAIRDAVAIVCEIEPATLSDATRFDDLGADSLARVSIADLVEERAAAGGSELHIDDASLSRMNSLGDLAEYATAHATDPAVLRVAS
jgi:acyl carrier protein